MSMRSTRPRFRSSANISRPCPATLGKASGACGRQEDRSTAVYCQARLFPDMFPLAKQVQLAADFAKNAASRLAGQEPPRFTDDEKTFEELQGRIAKTLRHIPDCRRPPSMPARTGRSPSRSAASRCTSSGATISCISPCRTSSSTRSTAYAILRENGVELGKRDFIGGDPGLRCRWPAFLHTADWQIGKPFGSFAEERVPSFEAQRLRTVERIARLAREREVDAVLVAGDAFDSQRGLGPHHRPDDRGPARLRRLLGLPARES